MKILINLVLIAFIGFLAYLLYANIQEPIKFRNVKQDRLSRVTSKLEQIRSAQEVYRDIVGEFANDFDTLAQVLKTDSIEFVKITVDPEDPENTDKFIREYTYTPAIDSISNMGIVLDSLRFVPFGGGLEFSIQADTLTYQKTLVSVVEVGTRWKDFMGEYASPRFSKYDNSYRPNQAVKFGDMNKPSLGGSWGR